MQDNALLSIPLAEELDFLTKLGEVLGKGLDSGHFDETLELWIACLRGLPPRAFWRWRRER